MNKKTANIIARAQAAVAAKKAREEKKLELEAAQREYEEKGFLGASDSVVSTGETTVSIRDSFVMNHVADSVSDAVLSAQTIENFGGSAIIQRFETVVDAEFGQEFFVTETRDFGGFDLPCKKSVWTDSKGIILPLKDIHARMGLGGSSDARMCIVSEVVHAQNETIELSYRPGNGPRDDSVRSSVKTFHGFASLEGFEDPKKAPSSQKSPYARKWAYQAQKTAAMRKYEQVVSHQDNVQVDKDKLIAADMRKDAQAVEKAAKAIAELSAGQKVPVPVVPIVEDVSWESPVKTMSRADKVAAVLRHRKNRKPAVPIGHIKLAAKKDCEKNILTAKEKLTEIKAELGTLVSGRLIAIPFRGKETRLVRSETMIQQLKAAATHQRMIISEERDELEYLDGEMS